MPAEQVAALGRNCNDALAPVGRMPLADDQLFTIKIGEPPGCRRHRDMAALGKFAGGEPGSGPVPDVKREEHVPGRLSEHGWREGLCTQPPGSEYLDCAPVEQISVIFAAAPDRRCRSQQRLDVSGTLASCRAVRFERSRQDRVRLIDHLDGLRDQPRNLDQFRAAGVTMLVHQSQR